MLYTWHMQCNYVQRLHIDTHTYEMREGFFFFLNIFSLINKKKELQKQQSNNKLYKHIFTKIYKT